MNNRYEYRKVNAIVKSSDYEYVAYNVVAIETEGDETHLRYYAMYKNSMGEFVKHDNILRKSPIESFSKEERKLLEALVNHKIDDKTEEHEVVCELEFV